MESKCPLHENITTIEVQVSDSESATQIDESDSSCDAKVIPLIIAEQGEWVFLLRLCVMMRWPHLHISLMVIDPNKQFWTVWDLGTLWGSGLDAKKNLFYSKKLVSNCSQNSMLNRKGSGCLLGIRIIKNNSYNNICFSQLGQ